MYGTDIYTYIYIQSSLVYECMAQIYTYIYIQSSLVYECMAQIYTYIYILMTKYGHVEQYKVSRPTPQLGAN